MPRCSSRSAVPHSDDAARLPCLTTRTPAPATTIAAMVEMFTVCARSPPVPTTSTASRACAAPSTEPRSTRAAAPSIASTSPAISPAVSPLARSATMNAAIWTGVALPATISPIAQAVSAVVSSSPRSRVTRSGGQVRSPTAGLRTNGANGVKDYYCNDGTPAARLRSIAAIVCPVVIGSSGWVSVASTRA